MRERKKARASMREHERERKSDNGREKAIENAKEKKTRQGARECARNYISRCSIYNSEDKNNYWGEDRRCCNNTRAYTIMNI